MFNRNHVLPALALAAALTPFAANAWTGQLSNQNPAVQQTLQPVAGVQLASGASTGRPGQFNPPAGYIQNGTTEYAATGAQVGDPNSLF